MKKVIKGFAYCKPSASYDAGNANVIDGFSYNYCHMSAETFGGEYIHVGTAELIVDVPDDFDPRSGAVDMLQKRKKEMMAEFQERMNEIDRQISQYTALEFVA